MKNSRLALKRDQPCKKNSNQIQRIGFRKNNFDWNWLCKIDL